MAIYVYHALNVWLEKAKGSQSLMTYHVSWRVTGTAAACW